MNFVSEQRGSTRSCRRWARLFQLVLLTFFVSSACQSTSTDNSSRGIIVINSPAAGEVRRVLVREGAFVDENTALFEIAVQTEAPNSSQSTKEDPHTSAVKNVVSAQAEIDAAREEVVRTELEVQLLTQRVPSGEAPQAQLDGARADYERAQQRLQKAQAASQEAQAGLVAARQPSPNSSSGPMVEQIVIARASSAGTVAAISVQVGARVTAGQPLATIRSQ